MFCVFWLVGGHVLVSWLLFFGQIRFLDTLSGIFILLTFYIYLLCFNIKAVLKKNIKYFSVFFHVLFCLIFLTFCVQDLFFFYIFFESLLIPMFIIVGYWGARERKIRAAYYFFLYTLVGSLVLLFGIIYLYFITGSTSFSVIQGWAFSENCEQRVLYACFFLAFATKIPVFPLHVWLPEAHVEAPTLGSIVLASILLKLGVYGFLRFITPILSYAVEFFNPLLFILTTSGIIYASLTTIRQVDLKRIIAYSSITHMNLIVLGIFSNICQGIIGAIYLACVHGIVSTALFFCVGVLYDRSHTRLLSYYGGLIETMPIFGCFLFIFILSNTGFPGTANFIGELLLFVGIFSNNFIVTIFASTGIVLSAVYSMWFFNRVMFGTAKVSYIRGSVDINWLEFSVLLPLVITVLFLGVNSDLLLKYF